MPKTAKTADLAGICHRPRRRQRPRNADIFAGFATGFLAALPISIPSRTVQYSPIDPLCGQPEETLLILEQSWSSVHGIDRFDILYGAIQNGQQDMSFYDSPDLTRTNVPTDILSAETLGTGLSPWRRVETTLMTTASTMRLAYDACFAHLDINLTQGSMLAYIVEFGPTTQSNIAIHLGHGRAATGATVDQLERRGLIERFSDPDDGRVRLVQVTATGQEMAERIRELDLYVSKELRSGISRAERRALASVLNRLQLNMLRVLGEDHSTSGPTGPGRENTERSTTDHSTTDQY